MIKFVDWIIKHQRAVRLTWYVFLAGIALLSLMVDKSHAHTWAEKHIPFFWSIYGFVAAAAAIGIARWYGHSGIQCREDYYDD